MSGSSLWFVIGLICLLIGIALVVQVPPSQLNRSEGLRTVMGGRLPPGLQVATIAPR